jgi:hypothetical protein
MGSMTNPCTYQILLLQWNNLHPASAVRSNHCVTLGTDVNGVRYLVVIDGCPLKNAVGDAGTLGLIQMVNRSCNPNCKLETIQTHAGLELFVLESTRDIGVEEEITIDYDAAASLTSKQQRSGNGDPKRFFEGRRVTAELCAVVLETFKERAPTSSGEMNKVLQSPQCRSEPCRVYLQ